MYQSYLVCVANTGNKYYHGIINIIIQLKIISFNEFRCTEL